MTGYRGIVYNGAMRIALLLLLLPTVANAQTHTIYLDYGSGEPIIVADNYLPPDTGYVYIRNGNRGVLEFSREYRYRPYLFDYSRHYHQHWR